MLELLRRWQKESQKYTKTVKKTRKSSTVKGHYRCINGNDTWIEEHTRTSHIVITTAIYK